MDEIPSSILGRTILAKNFNYFNLVRVEVPKNSERIVEDLAGPF